MMIDEQTKFLKKQLDCFELPADALRFLCELYDAIQFLDDVADGVMFSEDKLSPILELLLVRFPLNPFYLKNGPILGGAIITAIHKWTAANDAERDSGADARSFCWRAAYYDVALLVYHLCHGFAKTSKRARAILSIYGENLGDYLQEHGVRGGE